MLVNAVAGVRAAAIDVSDATPLLINLLGVRTMTHHLTHGNIKLQLLRAADAERYLMLVTCGIVLLMVFRIAAGAMAPLAFDEAYYWLWSKHLAGGYFDHPPMVALVIRLGTLIAGDTELGVRLVSALLAAPATWAVWRSAQILFKDAKLSVTAALFFNLTLMVAVGTVVVTPDAPLLVASAFVLFFLAKLIETGQGLWWLAVGISVGTALLSKYTAWFLGLSIFVWLMIAPQMRRWLLTPWPWLGGLIALLSFMPVLLWNAHHDWDSFVYIFSRRLIVNEWTIRYLGEYLASQAGLATPPIFVLGMMGLLAPSAGKGDDRCARILVGAMVWPLATYFAWHSLHQRVEGNWTSPIFPVLSIAAAFAVHGVQWTGRCAQVVRWSDRLATPTGVGIAAVIYAQSVFGVFPLGAIDPTARQLGAGWRQLASEIDLIRQRIGAHGVLTTNYGLTGWLSFYLPSHPPVVQVNERFRWQNEPVPNIDFFNGSLIFVCRFSVAEAGTVEGRYKDVREIATVFRERSGVAIERYSVYRVERPIDDPLDNTTLHDVLEQQRKQPALERRVREQGQTPAIAARPVQSCESGRGSP